MRSAFDGALGKESNRASDARARTQGQSEREVEGTDSGARRDGRKIT